MQIANEVRKVLYLLNGKWYPEIEWFAGMLPLNLYRRYIRIALCSYYRHFCYNFCDLFQIHIKNSKVKNLSIVSGTTIWIFLSITRRIYFFALCCAAQFAHNTNIYILQKLIYTSIQNICFMLHYSLLWLHYDIILSNL